MSNDNYTSTAASTTHDYAKHASEYAQLGFEGTYYLAFRDLRNLFSKHGITGRALDYGCGTGRSTRFLKDLGLDTIGVDINPTMLTEALRDDANGTYLKVRTAELPFEDNSFDLAF